MPLTRIHDNAVKAWTLAASLYGLSWFIPTIIYLIAVTNLKAETGEAIFQNNNWWLFGGIFLITFLFYVATVFFFPRIRWRRWRYEVSEKEIDLLRGIIIKKRTLVPINRVQHVDTIQGPIDKRYKISSVAISTAATTHEIPALDDETADDLRNKISSLVQKVKEDV
ncbi:MAG: hypothetical protein FH748_03515 [Balneolaceae bacterium]|nr:hypothetical protein [Balneolaceae bacterium]